MPSFKLIRKLISYKLADLNFRTQSFCRISTKHKFPKYFKCFQCQCLPPTTPSTPPNCIPYDSRLQAASLEEAIVAFPDLTITRQEKTQQSVILFFSLCFRISINFQIMEICFKAFSECKVTIIFQTATLNNCKTKQCRDCYKDLRSQLRKVGSLLQNRF